MNSFHYERLKENMRHLKLTVEVDGIIEEGIKRDATFTELLADILEAEVRTRRERLIEMRIKQARFPWLKTIDAFDFDFQPSIDRRRIEELLTLRFLALSENIVLLGPPGVGKTHLAVALGIRACEEGERVFFTACSDMLINLKRALDTGRFREKVRYYLRPRLLIVDEMGYFSMDRQCSNIFFQIVSKRYEKGSIILTANRSYGEWGEIFSDNIIASAILDRLLHHSTTINIKGQSYRLKERAKAGLPVQQQTGLLTFVNKKSTINEKGGGENSSVKSGEF